MKRCARQEDLTIGSKDFIPLKLGANYPQQQHDFKKLNRLSTVGFEPTPLFLGNRA